MVRLHGIPFACAYSCARVFSGRQQVVAPYNAGYFWFGFPGAADRSALVWSARRSSWPKTCADGLCPPDGGCEAHRRSIAYLCNDRISRPGGLCVRANDFRYLSWWRVYGHLRHALRIRPGGKTWSHYEPCQCDGRNRCVSGFQPGCAAYRLPVQGVDGKLGLASSLLHGFTYRAHRAGNSHKGERNAAL